MLNKKTTVSFTASADSAAISTGLIFAVQVPASFGVTSLVLLYCDTFAGTYIPVCDETNTAIGLTVDSTNAKIYDMSNIFPIGLARLNNNVGGYIKFRAPSSITKDIIVYQGA